MDALGRWGLSGWNRTEERWKRAALQATSAEHYPAERERLASEVARRVWKMQSGSQEVLPSHGTVLLALEIAATPYLTDATLRCSVRLRYLDVLETGVAAGDYEDVPQRRGEAAWAEEFLLKQLEADRPGTASAATLAREPGQTRTDRLAEQIAVRVLAGLRAYKVSAA